MNSPFHPFYNFNHPGYFRRRNYYSNFHNNLSLENHELDCSDKDTADENKIEPEKRSNTSFNLDKPILEFRGFKLYYDDMLILALIYFLYLENINDTLLYLALFALLFF